MSFKWTDEAIQKLKELTEQGMSAKEIADILGAKASSVATYRSKLGFRKLPTTPTKQTGEVVLLRAICRALVKKLDPPKSDYDENGELRAKSIKFGNTKTYEVVGSDIVCSDGTFVDLDNPPKGFDILKVKF